MTFGLTLAVVPGSALFPSVSAAQDTEKIDEMTLEAESDETLDQLEDQAPRTLLEALNSTAAVTPGNFGYDSRCGSFFLRGFPAYQTGGFRDRLRNLNGLSAWYRNDRTHLRGLRLLKARPRRCSASARRGVLVNVFSKCPPPTPYHVTRISYGRVEAALDFTGSLDANGNIQYRFVALAHDGDIHIAGYDDDRTLLVLSVSNQLSDDKRLLLSAEYAKDQTGTVAYFNFDNNLKVTNAPADDPDYNRFDLERFRLGYEYSCNLGSDRQLHRSDRCTEVPAEGITARAMASNPIWCPVIANSIPKRRRRASLT